MTVVERAFYEWFHANKPASGVLLENYREAFIAGWEAANHPAVIIKFPELLSEEFTRQFDKYMRDYNRRNGLRPV